MLSALGFRGRRSSRSTQTFLVARTCKTEVEAQRFAAYLRTKFVRYLVHQRKVSQHTTSDTYMFVPDIPMDREWTDTALYARYGLSAEDIAPGARHPGSPPYSSHTNRSRWPRTPRCGCWG